MYVKWGLVAANKEILRT